MTETAHPVTPAKPPPLIQELARRRSWSERRGGPQRVAGAGIEVERARRRWSATRGCASCLWVKRSVLSVPPRVQ
ncbi:hypothetical protein C6341_g23003 [Phytophthora cactorum]|nr:hypothetical protein C6341_g23003 [Phytophthora cactorum]